MTAPREQLIDFSHPYFTTTLGVLTRDTTSFYDNFVWIISRVSGVLIAFAVVLYIIGFLADKIDGDENIRNPHEGAWWALVTFTTTGYGDLVPKTAKGKMFAAFWMIVSIFLLSSFTGYVASAMTVKKLSDNPTTINDLYHAGVVTIRGSTSQEALDNLGISYKTADNIEMAFEVVKSKRASALMYDKAILDYIS